jgi:hypothetical protein
VENADRDELVGNQEPMARQGIDAQQRVRLRAVARTCEQGSEPVKLTSEQIERTLSQFEAKALPNNHPVVPRLTELFGDHTFFLDNNGLNIVEPTAEASGEGTQAARVVNLANWSDANLSSLSPHEPEPTDAIVELGSKH